MPPPAADSVAAAAWPFRDTETPTAPTLVLRQVEAPTRPASPAATPVARAGLAGAAAVIFVVSGLALVAMVFVRLWLDSAGSVMRPASSYLASAAWARGLGGIAVASGMLGALVLLAHLFSSTDGGSRGNG